LNVSLKRLAPPCALALMFCLAVHPHVAGAQTVPLPLPAPPQRPALQVTPGVLGPDGIITIALPPGPSPATTRQRVGLFEAGRAARVADALVNFSARDGRLQATLNLQADPGEYELRLIANDRAAAMLSEAAPLVVPGIDREPGWWLLNGTPFIETPFSETAADVNPDLNSAAPLNAPLFVPGLRRDFGKKPRRIVENITVSQPQPLKWQVFRLPSLRDMLAPGYDWTALRATVERDVRAAQARGDRYYAGFLLPTGAAAEAVPLPATAGNALNSVRQITNSLAPDAALILNVDATRHPALAARDIEAGAALCDAVALELDPYFNEIWPVKVARRVAEEQTNYDLPIFVQLRRIGGRRTGRDESEARTAVFDYLMAGATGIISGAGMNPDPAYARLIRRNASLFIGSVTLEDIGILPALDQPEGQGDASIRLSELLRAAGRIPLLARLTRFRDDRNPESFVVTLGDRVSSGTVENFKSSATSGARIYIEGAPLLDEKGQPSWKLSPLVGATATAVKGGRGTMTLEDPWTFGTGRGARVTVEQSVTVKLDPVPPSKSDKKPKDKDEPTGPRVVARLEDGSPAVIINSVGKGEIIWMPHGVVETTPLASGRTRPSLRFVSQGTPAPGSATTRPGVAAPVPSAPPLLLNRWTPAQRYYAAVSDFLQPRLVQVRGVEPQAAGGEAVRVALRRSPRGTMLLALFNTATRPATIAAAVNGVAGLAYDLSGETELPVTTRGFQSQTTVTLPAQGWKIIAFSTTRKAFDEERNTPRLKARLR